MKDSRKFALVAAALVVAALVIGIVCQRTRDGGGVTTAGVGSPCDLSSDSVRRMTRRDFVRWAAAMPYEAVDTLAGRAHGTGATGISVHRVRGSDSVTRAQIQDGCLIARIRSTSADAAVGLGAGWTYVWADSTNPYTATLVPEQETAPVTTSELAFLPGDPAPGVIASPRYICSDCGSDWCVYPKDETRLPPEMFVGEPAPTEPSP